MMLTLCVVAFALAAADDRPHANAQKQSGAFAPKPDEVREIWPMSIREAMRLGLENNPNLRVIFAGDRNAYFAPNCFGGRPTEVEDAEKRPRPTFANRTSIVVEPASPDVTTSRIKSDIAATIRAVEKQYGDLAASHVALWGADKALNCARELIEIEEYAGDPFCREDLDDLATALKRLPRYEKTLAARYADVNTAEQQFRKLLGISKFDQRQIVPVTPPIETPLGFAWCSCLDSVITKSQNPLQLKDYCRVPSKNLFGALDALDEISPRPDSYHQDELSILRWTLYPIREAYPCLSSSLTMPFGLVLLRRMTGQPPPEFAKAAHEANRSYKRYWKAHCSRFSAELRMETQRHDWCKGRIAADRYLDTVEQFGLLAESERRQSAAYESAVSTVNEREGILLDEHNIIVANRSDEFHAEARPSGTSPRSASR
jgi:hypothetical protein